jgi:hypothetical protein
MSTTTIPTAASDLVFTNVVSTRAAGAKKFASVTFHPETESVEYRVTPTNGDVFMVERPFAGVASGKELAFIFPVTKGFTYFINVTIHIGGGSHNVSWLYDPFKRRAVPKSEVAPAGVAAAPAPGKAKK